MPDSAKKKLSTEPYKGVRDFYPEDMFIENYIFTTMREAAESFGYVEYGASVLEPTELYEAKTGEEIVNEQTYSFTDRGGRSVTLRPEMTPTVARMVAAKRRDLPLPVRWYSIPNVFRYERPQRGRLREHWQLNCDLFGISGIDAEVEIIALASHVLKSFGAQEQTFEIRVNNRELLNILCKELGATGSVEQLLKLIDRKEKMEPEAFKEELSAMTGTHADTLLRALSAPDLPSFTAFIASTTDLPASDMLRMLMERLQSMGITNVQFSPTLVRGFDYYSGTVFEIFDTSPDNRRSLFGGGRYDNLLEIFSVDALPAVGFGMGDVTMRDFLETHQLLPIYTASADLYICTVTTSDIPPAQELAQELRQRGLSVSVNLTDKKVGDQIKSASRQAIPFIVTYGDEERQSGSFKLKHLGTGEESTVLKDEIADRIFSFIG